MKLEVGKRYICRNRLDVVFLFIERDDIYSGRFNGIGYAMGWYSDGTFRRDKRKHPFDLIDQYSGDVMPFLEGRVNPYTYGQQPNLPPIESYGVESNEVSNGS